MKLCLSLVLILAIVVGQLVKFPFLTLPIGTLLDLVVGILCLIGLIELKLKLSRPPLYILLALIFIVISCLSLGLTPLHLSWSQYLISFSYIIRFGVFILLGWIIYSGGLSGIRRYIPEILISSGVILSILGLLQLIFIPDLSFLQVSGWDPHFFRAVSTLLDPNFLAVFLGGVLLVIISYSGQSFFPGWQVSKSNSKKLRAFLFGLVFLVEMATFSRSGLLMFIGSFVVLSWLRRSTKLFFLTIILSLTFAASYLGYNQLIANLRHIDRTQSAELRISSWHIGLELVKHYPILGVGFNSYRYGLEQNKLAPPYYVLGHGGSSNDSSLIFVASTTGIVGLVVYIAMIVSLFFSAWKDIRQNNLLGYILFSGLSGLMANSLFIDSLFYPWTLLWIFLIATHKQLKKTKNSNQ